MRKGRKLPDHQSKHHELNRAENSESTALKKERPFLKKEKKKQNNCKHSKFDKIKKLKFMWR